MRNTIRGAGHDFTVEALEDDTIEPANEKTCDECQIPLDLVKSVHISHGRKLCGDCYAEEVYPDDDEYEDG